MAATRHPKRRSRHSDRAVAYAGMFRLWEWRHVAVLAVLGVGFGVWGFLRCDVCDDVATPFAMITKLGSMMKGGMPYPLDDKHPWQLVAAQLLLPGIFLFGAVKLVLLNMRRDVRVALARGQSNHTIVCGLGDSGRQIVENLRADLHRVVAVTLDDTAPNAIACERLGVAVLKGDATQIGMLCLAGLLRAETVVATCGSDTTNMEIALRIKAALDMPEERPQPLPFLPEAMRIRVLAWLPREARTGGNRPLHVLPEIRSAWLLDLVRTHPTANLSGKTVETRPFDLAANAARRLLDRPEFGRLWRLFGAAEAPALQPHLLLAGLGELGMQIVSRAVQTTFALPGARLAVTILDRDGEASAAALHARYPGLRDLVDWEFVQTVFDAENPSTWPQVWTAVEAELADRAANWTTVAAIVALKEDKDSLHAALRTRERLDRLGCAGTPVLVRLRQRRELGQFAASLDGVQSLLGRLTPFGDLGELTGLDMLDDSRQDSLARAVHDTYRVGNARSEADRPWSELPERFKQSNRASADHIPVKLGSVGLRLVEGRSASAEPTPAEIEAMSAVEHHRWVIERQTMGWTRTPRGTKPDAVARLHPDLVAWEELDEDDREKDRVVVRTIARSSAAAGLSIRRERLIDAASHGLAAAEAALAAVTADELAVVIFDPHDTASFEFAEDAARRGAKLWVRWREGSHNRLVAPATPSATLLAAIELAVSEREAAAILGLALPKSSTRRRAPAKRPAQTA